MNLRGPTRIGVWRAAQGCDLGRPMPRAYYSTGLGVLGGNFADPIRVRTLDEIVLITRKSTGLVFDDTLPDFHFYGTDICLRSELQGRSCYIIPLLVLRSQHTSALPTSERLLQVLLARETCLEGLSAHSNHLHQSVKMRRGSISAQARRSLATRSWVRPPARRPRLRPCRPVQAADSRTHRMRM